AERWVFVQTVPAKGYRFIAPVAPMDVEDAAASQAPENEIGADRSDLGRFRLIHLTVAAVAVVGLAAVWIVTASRDHIARLPSTPVIRSLAGLPLENVTGDPSQDYFSDGGTDVLITDLARISALRVGSGTSSMRFKGTRRPLPEIAHDLGVDAIVEGTVMRSAQRVRVTAQVVRANPEGHVWADQYDRPLGDVVALQAELAHAISQAIRIT